MSTLEELYHGNVCPMDKLIQKGSQYQKLHKQLTRQIDALTALLNEEEKQLLETIGDTVSDLCYLSEKESFIEGFCLGGNMIWEMTHFTSENFC